MSALHELLHRSIDYAGLFPPAKLDMRTALREFDSYQRHPHAEFLARFVMPLDRLREAHAAYEGRARGISTTWRCAGLLKVGSLSASDAREVVVESAGALQRGTPRIIVDVVEADLPADLAPSGTSGKALLQWLDFLRKALPSGGGEERGIFLELDWRKDFEPAMARLSESDFAVGVKLRTGGLTPDMIPPVRRVAEFVVCAAKYRLPIKVTAGIHVPVPNLDQTVGARMHGFLNIFTAALAAYSNKGTESEIASILENAGYDDFRFTESEYRCRAIVFSKDEIRDLRTRSLTSFGSCSFLEPLQHLRDHGLL